MNGTFVRSRFLVALAFVVGFSCSNAQAQHRAAATEIVAAGGITARVTTTSFPDSGDYSIFVSSSTGGALNVNGAKKGDVEAFVSAVVAQFAVDTSKPLRVFVKVSGGYVEFTLAWTNGVPSLLDKPSRTSNEFKDVVKQESEP